MEAGQLFCGSCYGESYGATCGGCGQKIGGDQLWVEALDQQWHSQCFTCTVRRGGSGCGKGGKGGRVEVVEKGGKEGGSDGEE